jgi:hypothetical protein
MGQRRLQTIAVRGAGSSGASAVLSTEAGPLRQGQRRWQGLLWASELAGRDLFAAAEDRLVDTIETSEKVVAWAQATQLTAIHLLHQLRTGLRDQDRAPVPDAVAKAGPHGDAGPDRPEPGGDSGDGSGHADPTVASTQKVAAAAGALPGRVRIKAGESASREVARALCLSPAGGTARVGLAAQLYVDLPDTLAALGDGRIDLYKARVIADNVIDLPQPTARDVERQVLPEAPKQTSAHLRQCVNEARIVADPRAAEQRHGQAMNRRRMALRPLPDGMSELWALLPAEGAQTIWTGLTSLAEAAKNAGDGGGADQRRADALVDVFRDILDRGDLPIKRTGYPHIHVTVAASTLAGLDERPGHLGGYGPITASVARQVAAGGAWRWLVTEGDGSVVAVGNEAHNPADRARAAPPPDRPPGEPHPGRPDPTGRDPGPERGRSGSGEPDGSALDARTTPSDESDANGRERGRTEPRDTGSGQPGTPRSQSRRTGVRGRRKQERTSNTGANPDGRIRRSTTGRPDRHADRDRRRKR